MKPLDDLALDRALRGSTRDGDAVAAEMFARRQRFETAELMARIEEIARRQEKERRVEPRLPVL